MRNHLGVFLAAALLTTPASGQVAELPDAARLVETDDLRGQVFHGVPMSELKDYVMLPDGRVLGGLEGFLAEDGRVTAIILEAGGVFEIGDMEVIMPLAFLSVDEEGRLVSLIPPEAVSRLSRWD